VGDEVEVYVLKLDREDQRISLSRKRLLPNPWDSVEERYAVHQLVEGTITRIVDYGAFAEVEPGIEGLLHISQLSRSTVQNPHEVVQEGEVHLLRIVSIDPRRQRMGLSLRAVTANEQIEWMAQRELEKTEDEETTAVADSSVDETAVDAAAVAEAEAVAKDTVSASEEE
jgi:ribosomal protein S1